MKQGMDTGSYWSKKQTLQTSCENASSQSATNNDVVIVNAVSHILHFELPNTTRFEFFRNQNVTPTPQKEEASARLVQKRDISKGTITDDGAVIVVVGYYSCAFH